MANRVLLVPKDVIEMTPSRKDGVEEEVETSLRIYGCDFIQRAGLYLKMRAVTVASSQTIFHRFFFRRSLKEFDVRIVAAASMYLACKLQEDHRRVRDVINVYQYIKHKEQANAIRRRKQLSAESVACSPRSIDTNNELCTVKESQGSRATMNTSSSSSALMGSNFSATVSGSSSCAGHGDETLSDEIVDETEFEPLSPLEPAFLDQNSKEFKALKSEIHKVERYLLRETGFLISQTLVHPHRFILQYIHSLMVAPFEDKALLSQKAWGYINDSLRTTLCCQVQPAVIAVTSIYLAACECDICLPQESRWYEAFDVAWDDIVRVSTEIRSLYLRPPARYIPLKKDDPIKIDTSVSAKEIELINSIDQNTVPPNELDMTQG